MTEERIKEIEETLLHADRKTLIGFADELGVWIGDLNELDDNALMDEVDNGLSVIRERTVSRDWSGGRIQTKNQLLNVLYSIKKEYVPKKEAFREAFAKEMTLFFDRIRYSNIPEFEYTEWFYVVELNTKRFTISLAKWDGDEDEMSLNVYATIFAQEVQISEECEDLACAYEYEHYNCN